SAGGLPGAASAPTDGTGTWRTADEPPAAGDAGAAGASPPFAAGAGEAAVLPPGRAGSGSRSGDGTGAAGGLGIATESTRAMREGGLGIGSELVVSREAVN